MIVHPVQLNALTDEELRAAPVAVSGTVALDANSLIALENINVNVEAGASVGVTNFPEEYPLPMAQLAALAPLPVQPVSGAVDIGNFPAKQATTDSTDVEYTSVATSVTAIGDTTIYTPAAGKRVRLHWIYAINDPVASSSTKITVKLGATPIYVAWAISKRQQFNGPINGSLVISLSQPGDVAVTAFVSEV